MARVVHFEIHASDPQRAIGFYSGLFDWTFDKYAGPQDYWLIKTGPTEQPGIDGGLIARRGPAPAGEMPRVRLCLHCRRCRSRPDGHGHQSAGGTIAVPKMPIPGLAWLAYAKDTEGNLFGVYQADPGAK